jgi:signal transduction histidine kinase
MNITRYLLTAALACTLTAAPAETADDYKTSAGYLALRNTMHKAFNDADTARFYRAVKKLKLYLLHQGDLHAYYTQRCNEIVFQLNRQNIFEAYKQAKQLSVELTDRKLDKEMYMAINMMGHIYHYSGNEETAKQCFREVIRRMEEEGYRESEPAIYMNLVSIVIEEDPQEALRLIDKAVEISRETAPDRVFDMESRRTLAYYRMGDMPRFLEGYKAYREGVAKGQNSVHGLSLEIYYLTSQGRYDEAIAKARLRENDRYETMAEIYSQAGRWKEAYEALKLGTAESDSINSVILSSSMQGIQEELAVYDAERRAEHTKLYALVAIVVLLVLLVVALAYIMRSRRRHLREIQKAYDRVLESDRMKTLFMQNVSHEVRTPLNIISGFAQVFANPDYQLSAEERQHIAETVTHNTHIITTMINEVLDLSAYESAAEGDMVPIACNRALRQIIDDFGKEDRLQGNTIDFQTTLDDAFTVVAQEELLKRILLPLVDNAVKNDPGGCIEVRAMAEDKRLVITVRDHGKGVPADEAEHIFERFVKLDSFKEGLGIGLPFSRTMARRIGGDVTLDTAFDGPGARFRVVI